MAQDFTDPDHDSSLAQVLWEIGCIIAFCLVAALLAHAAFRVPLSIPALRS